MRADIEAAMTMVNELRYREGVGETIPASELWAAVNALYKVLDDGLPDYGDVMGEVGEAEGAVADLVSRVQDLEFALQNIRSLMRKEN